MVLSTSVVLRSVPQLLVLVLVLVVALNAVPTVHGQVPEVLDNRATCAHRVLNCDPSIDHFETKISMKHSSSVTRLDYENTHVLLEQSWPTRGPWMKNTTQKVLLVRCGCPIPALSSDWSDANIIHVPVSTVMVQMPNTLSKVYMMGQRSKVAAIESNRWISDATPEIASDIRDGIVQRLDLAPNGIPSTRITLSFENGWFADANSGFRLQLVDGSDGDVDNESSSVVGETDCIYPHPSATAQDPIESVMDSAFNSIPGWVGAGNVWVLTAGEANPSEGTSTSTSTSTSLSYTMYFDNQLPMGLGLRGDASSCGGNVNDNGNDNGNELTFKIERDAAPNNRPIYHRLHDLPGGFPDVLITEPRSLGPLADDPKVLARQFLDSDPGEATPLGRAELMKLVALLVGSEETGNTLFETIETRYEDAKAIAATATKRPTVMVGKPGTWNEAARNSWMITVGSTYVGEFLRDANVEYRNSDDSVNTAICGSGCGACPSGTSDTRCSVAIDDYLELFKKSDYWISAGIGANCWSGSCNFDISADALLDQNRDVFSQFLPMQCGSLIGLDKSQRDVSGGGGGVSENNQYWELGRLRPDLVLTDLVTLMHPDLGMDEDSTTFFRRLAPLSNATGVPQCPRTRLPTNPLEGTVHVTSVFAVDVSASSSGNDGGIIGAARFAVFDQFYPTANAKIAEALGLDTSDVEIAMSNANANANVDSSSSSVFGIAVTVRVGNCQDRDNNNTNNSNHSCGTQTGEKLDALGPDIEDALGLSWAKVQRDTSRSTLVLDREGDIIPLEALVTGGSGSGSSNSSPVSTTATATGTAVDSTNDNVELTAAISESGKSKGNGGQIAGIVIGIVAAFLVAVLATYKVAYAQGAKTTAMSYESEKETARNKEGPQMVDETIS